MYKLIIIFMVMVLLVVGCGSKPAIIPQDKTVTMQSVYPPADSKFRTYSAMLLALIDNKCRVTALDLDKNIITAENCYKMSKFCMSIKGIISLDWQATFVLVDKGLGERRISKIATQLRRSRAFTRIRTRQRPLQSSKRSGARARLKVLCCSVTGSC